MKKIYILAISFLMLSALKSNAQDTLVYESFNFQSFYDNMITDVVPPPGTLPLSDPSNALWYSYDKDGLNDGSGAGRDGGWFAVQPFSDVDTTNNVAIGANSWFDSPALAENYLITPVFNLGAHDTLFWKSAPSQTPRYLDGYQVQISTTTNDDLSFNTTLFTAAEMTSLGSDTTFSTFGFSTGFVHGQDGTYIDIATTTAPILHTGQLRPFSVPLDAYANQSVFIAFYHRTFDDNMISIDDFMIRGQHAPLGITENSNELGLNVFPNPATDMSQVNYNLAAESAVVITVYDITGKVIASENKGTQATGRHFSMINTANLAKGFYTVSVQTATGRSTVKLMVN
ncbi:MAG: hypothetical protein JWP12_1440 [Bacteroidetes bacterium]|nr:hypothetical protein [Bacteroidota bacterium]